MLGRAGKFYGRTVDRKHTYFFFGLGTLIIFVHIYVFFRLQEYIFYVQYCIRMKITVSYLKFHEINSQFNCYKYPFTGSTKRFKCEKLTDGRQTLTHDKSSHGLWPGELTSMDKKEQNNCSILFISSFGNASGLVVNRISLNFNLCFF
jgi:hypothetical protein